jgi:tRNA pseudouridine55 synthase
VARKREPSRLHGLIVMDKPAGFTSHDVVAKLRRITGERKAGHAGTLDPMATGVLPVAFGDATRVLEYLAGASKVYRAEITFGVATDTLDAEGRVTAIDPNVAITRERLESALTTFRGAFDQLPPMHSAIKIGGVKLYELARRGEEIDRPARPVEVHGIELVDWQAPVATIDVHSSKGFYVRSLARDLGERLGTVAHLSNLVRLATGPFSLADAWTFGELETLTRDEIAGVWSDVALHPDSLLNDVPAIVIGNDDLDWWRQGRGILLAPVTDETVNVYAADGTWLGIGRGVIERSEWQPVKVMGGGASVEPEIATDESGLN